MSGTAALSLLAALAIDRALGEWPAAVHPVLWMGRTIRAVERRAPQGRAGAFLWGLGLATLLPTAWAALAWASTAIPWIGPILAVFWLKSSFALRALGEAGQSVARPLQADDLTGARQGLRNLCSRDPSTLDADQLAAGAVESLAENLSDSFVAPLFWFAIAGVPGAVAYRVLNTADAMIGYHGRYEWLGKAAARLDDLANLAPARLSAALLLLVGGGRARAGWRTLRRDRAATESPNAGWPMAAMAGLLGVALDKPGHYRLGGDGRAPTGADITAAWRLCTQAARLWTVLVLVGMALAARA